MTITSLGELSVGATVPGAASACAAGDLGINLALPDIEARLSALADVIAHPPLPIDFSAQLTQAVSIVASIQSCITLGITPPDMSAQIAAFTALMAELEASVLSINAQLTVIADLTAALAAVGVELYAFEGPADTFGGELTVAIGVDFAPVNGLALVVHDPATWTALSQIMKVSP